MEELQEDHPIVEKEPAVSDTAGFLEGGTMPDPGPLEEPVHPSPSENPSPVKPPATASRSWVYRFFNFLLGADTTVGRILRPVLRWTAAVVGLFSLGLLAAYLLLYQPTQQSLVSAGLQNDLANQSITRLQDQVAGMQSTLTASNQAVKSAQDALNKAKARNDLLVVIFDIANARTYLAQKEGAKLMDTLTKTRSDMDIVMPYLSAAKKDLADELNSRLETVRSVVVRDPQLAQSDLDNLYTAIVEANDLLFAPNS